MKRMSILFAAMTLGIASASAQTGDHSQHPTAAASPPANAASQLASGDIVKVDKDAARLTIRHGALAHLNMSAMTMAFRVRSPAMLDQVKPGDKVGFVPEKVNGALTVTLLEAAPTQR
jgi:Cu(I)/Ag(I) efflux system protein CusF